MKLNKKTTFPTVMVELDAIQAHPDNYNRHPPEQVAKLRASLREFGQPKPIVAWDRGGGVYLCAAGHGLVMAARLEEWSEIEVKVLPEEWDAARVKAYLVADNETARQSERDDVQLASLLEDVRNFDETLLPATGFTEEEYSELLDQLGAGASNVQKREVEKRPPPKMVWALIGIPVVSYSRIADLIEHVALDPEAIVETTTSDE